MLTNEQIDRLLSQGGNVLSEDGEKIGSIGQVFVDNDDGQPSWVTVRTGLFGLSESFVPLEGARTEGEDMVVPYGKNQVKDAPRIDADHPLEPAEEDRLYEHYHLGRGRTPSEATTGSADFTAAPRTDGYDTAGRPTDDTTTPGAPDATDTGRQGAPDATRTTGYDTAGRPTDDTTTPAAAPDTTDTGRQGAPDATRTTGYDTAGRPTDDTTTPAAAPDTTDTGRQGAPDATRPTGYDTSGRPTEDITTPAAAPDTTRTAGYDTAGRPTDDTTTPAAAPDTTRTAGDDTSGRPTDDTTTRPQTPQNLGSEQPPAGRTRLRKYVTTENVARTVPVQHQEIRIEREPITDENRDEVLSGPDSGDEHDVILYEERLKVEKENVPVERVRIGTETVTDEVTVNGEVHKEHIGTEGTEGSEEGRR
jgi:uncharacterized protein (TIGR02271 family)